ncbi:hypothetical protein [Jatrophihabitans endophyticus]|uniref:hypothetical protein n=1 Tax=Jatrophihabitans endophyticus TaxID=1206085 RepID=UPI0019F73A17|nr:hypothetical protein [Jatrophihabitans endophyticus]MBE7187806.1 hypothetical protein [Jatrophihabitans endophyticus]
MTFPGAHGYYKADEAIRPNGGDGLEHVNSAALRAEHERVRELKRAHPGFFARLAHKVRRRA